MALGQRYALYDLDTDRLASMTLYHRYCDAADHAAELTDVIVVGLPVGSSPTTPNPDDEGPDDESPAEETPAKDAPADQDSGQ